MDPLDHTRRREIPAGTPGEDLLGPIFRGGRPVGDRPPLAASRQRTIDELSRLSDRELADIGLNRADLRQVFARAR